MKTGYMSIKTKDSVMDVKSAFTLKSEDTEKYKAERGDYALAVIKNDEYLHLMMLNDPSEITNSTNTEILKLAKETKSNIFKVQFLDNNRFSIIELILDGNKIIVDTL